MESSELPTTRPVDFRLVSARWREQVGDELETLPSDKSYRSRRPTPPAAAVQALHFTRLGLLGKGGMGEVHRALQSGLRREVALKVLRSDRERSEQARRHFVAEAVITGQLEHPNIIPVYALQAEPGGEISLALKLIGGQSWKQALREERAQGPIRGERLEHHLEVLRQVGNALAFAHSRGILHLDLKPENVMLGAFGEVLVLDWGLAAAFGEVRPPGLPHVADIDEPCGTPAYIPPELALGDGRSIGVHSDVYLLGAALYEVLCGKPPHRGNMLACLRRALLGPAVELPEEVPAELAAICLRALAREPERRYASVQEMQAALKDYLLHRESHAVADSARALLRGCEAGKERPTEALYADFTEAVAAFKQAHRLWPANDAAVRGRAQAHEAFGRTALARGDLALAATQLAQLPAEQGAALRAEVESALARQDASVRTQRRLKQALLAAGLLLLLGLSGGLFVIALQNEDIREQAEQIRRERDDAKARGHIAITALSELTHEVRDELMIDVADSRSQAAARRLLESARGHLEGLLAAHIARATIDIGTVEVLLRLCELTIVVDGKLDEALELWKEASTRADTLAARGRMRPVLMCDLLQVGADLHARLGALQRSDELLGRALALVDGPADATSRRAAAVVRLALADLRIQQGRYVEAEPLAERSLAAARQLLAEEPDSSEYAEHVSEALLRLIRVRDHLGEGESAEALSAQLVHIERKRLAADPTSPTLRESLALALLRRAALLEAQGRGDPGALRAEALALYRQLRLRSPESSYLANGLAQALLGNAEHLLRRGALEEAEELAAEAVALQRSLVERDARSANARSALLEGLRVLAEIQRAAGGHGLEALRERAALSATLVGLDSTDAGGRRDHARALLDLGHARLLRGELGEALRLHREGLALLQDLAERNPALDSADRELLPALAKLGEVLLFEGQIQEALKLQEQQVALAEGLWAQQPDSAQARRDLSIAYDGLAAVLETRGELERADPLRAESLELRRELAAEDPGDWTARDDLWRALLAAGDLARSRGDVGRAGSCYQEALTGVRAMVAADSSNLRVRRDLGAVLDRVGDLRKREGDLAGARVAYEEAIGLAQALVDATPDDLQRRRDLAMAHQNLGMLLRAEGSARAALESFQASHELLAGLHDAVPDNPMFERDVGASLIHLAETRLALGAVDEAIATFLVCFETFEALARAFPDAVEAQRDLVEVSGMLAHAFEQLGSPDQAVLLYEEQVRSLQSFLSRVPGSLEMARRLTQALYHRSRMAEQLGEVSAAARWAGAAVRNHRALLGRADVERELAALAGVEARLLTAVYQAWDPAVGLPATRDERWVLGEACLACGDVAAALDVYEGSLVEPPALQAEPFIAGARAASRGAALAPDVAARCAQLGLRWLEAALQRGAERDALREDPGLVWLREQPGATELLAGE